MLLICGLLLFGSLIGQPPIPNKAAVAKLSAALVALRNANEGGTRESLGGELADAMMALADDQHRPSRSTISSFADALTGTLNGKSIRSPQISQLQQCLSDVMRGSTTNLQSASRLRETLTALHIGDLPAQVIIKRFLAIGEEVRGPDDLPALAIK